MTSNPNKAPTLITGSDTDSFCEIYVGHWKMLCLFAFRITGNMDMAKDIVQEVFIDLLTKKEGTYVFNISAYLYHNGSLKF